jgi:hypothetical protein
MPFVEMNTGEGDTPDRVRTRPKRFEEYRETQEPGGWQLEAGVRDRLREKHNVDFGISYSSHLLQVNRERRSEDGCWKGFISKSIDNNVKSVREPPQVQPNAMLHPHRKKAAADITDYNG